MNKPNTDNNTSEPSEVVCSDLLCSDIKTPVTDHIVNFPSHIMNGWSIREKFEPIERKAIVAEYLIRDALDYIASHDNGMAEWRDKARQFLAQWPKSATCEHNRKTIMTLESTESESTPTTPSGEQVGSTALFSRALRAICLTRDYVGEQLLPAIEGWEWYDAGVELMNAIPDDEWAEQFRLRTQPCPECQRPNPRHKDGCTTQMMREMHCESSGENR